ncbi:MAG TPA: hypothetical protein VF121_01075 [Thermoanaerobaculia bacterium]|nr:hypothetical protein [Thermoanaerobaculia bacterium]
MAGRRGERLVPLPPTPLTRKFFRYLGGFGVATGMGLAPVLGQLDLPLLTPLLHLIPRSLRDTLVPLSALLMGLMAVVVQWLGQERRSRAWLRKAFVGALIAAGVAFLLLVVLHLFVVVRVSVLGGEWFETFVVGFTRPDADACRGYSNAECVQRLSLDEKRIASHWGDGQIGVASLCLELAYLLLTGSFGALVGLVVLREASRRRRAKKS